MPKTSLEAKKQTLLANLIDARSQVIEAAAIVPGDMQDAPFLGAWSTHDIVAHLIGWDAANLEAMTAIQAGCLPGFYSEYDADWKTYNAALVKHYRRPTMSDTLAGAKASHRSLLDALEALSPDDVFQDYGVRSPRGRRVTISMLLQAEAEDERKHAEQIRAFALQQRD